MKTYSPGEIASAIGVSASSIRNWTEQAELQAYLSDMAVRRNQYESAKQREYTLEDLYVLNTIAKAKTRHNSWQDVADFLEDGNLYDANNVGLVHHVNQALRETAAEGFADKIILHQRIEFLESALRDQEAEIEQLRKRVEEVRKSERDMAKTERAELQTTINELNRTIGKLEAQIEMLKDEED